MGSNWASKRTQLDQKVPQIGVKFGRSSLRPSSLGVPPLRTRSLSSWVKIRLPIYISVSPKTGWYSLVIYRCFSNEFSLFTQKLLKILLQALMSLATFMMDSQINDVPMTIKFKMGPILWAWNIAPVQIAGTIFYLRINNSMKSCMPDDMMHHRKGYQGAHSCGMARLRSSRYFQTYIIFRSTLNIINLQSARQFGHNWSTCHNRNNMLENTLSP